MRGKLRGGALATIFISTLVLAAPSAWATTITYDFASFAANELLTPHTASVAQGEGGYASFWMTVGGLTVTATGSHDGDPAFAYLDGRSSGLLAGMGVCHATSGRCAGSDDDNITSDEILKLVFGQSVSITNVVFRDQDHKTDKFASDDDFKLRVGGAGTFGIFDFPTNDDGLWTPPGSVSAGTIFEFKHKNEDFYISTITVDVPDTTVPEPGSLLLLGSGLLGLARLRRRQRG